MTTINLNLGLVHSDVAADHLDAAASVARFLSETVGTAEWLSPAGAQGLNHILDALGDSLKIVQELSSKQ